MLLAFCIKIINYFVKSKDSLSCLREITFQIRENFTIWMKSVNQVTWDRVWMTHNYLICVSVFWRKYWMIWGFNYLFHWILEVSQRCTCWTCNRSFLGWLWSAQSWTRSAVKSTYRLKLSKSLFSWVTRAYKCTWWW